jgi:hypothetical protein
MESKPKIIGNIEYKLEFDNDIFTRVIEEGNFIERVIEEGKNIVKPLYYIKLKKYNNDKTNTYSEKSNESDTTKFFYSKIFLKEYENNLFSVNSNIVPNYLLKKSQVKSINTIKNSSKKIKWLDCKDNCFEELSKSFKDERKYTLMWITLILNYMLHPSNLHYELVLYINSVNFNSLTGYWENDKQYFRLSYKKKINNDVSIDEYKKSYKLTAYGPSASGKTFLGRILIDMQYELNQSHYLAKTFIAIDGGIDRNFSLIYRKVNHFLKQFDGNEESKEIQRINLTEVTMSVRRFLTRKQVSLFKKYKSEITDYFNSYKDKNGIKLNYYIPTTKAYKKYYLIRKNSTNELVNTNQLGGTSLDTDISLICNIYQCKEECKYKNYPNYECTTTTKSGIKRSIDEGKRYSSASYEASYKTGLDKVKETNGLHIHNCGRPDGISIIIDYNNNNPLISSTNMNNDKLNISSISSFEYDLEYNNTKFRYAINKECVYNIKETGVLKSNHLGTETQPKQTVQNESIGNTSSPVKQTVRNEGQTNESIGNTSSPVKQTVRNEGQTNESIGNTSSPVKQTVRNEGQTNESIGNTSSPVKQTIQNERKTNISELNELATEVQVGGKKRTKNRRKYYKKTKGKRNYKKKRTI